MLPKINRIKKKKDFEAIFKKGKGFKNSFLFIKAVKNNIGQNRFGFIVSQKISKKAVVRNKTRRRLSEIAQKNIKNIKNGQDILMVALPGIEKKDFSEIKKEADGLLNKMFNNK